MLAWSNLDDQAGMGSSLLFCDLLHLIWWVVMTVLQFLHAPLATDSFNIQSLDPLGPLQRTIDSAWRHDQLIHKNKPYKKLWKRQTPFHGCSINIWVDNKCFLIQRELT